MEDIQFEDIVGILKQLNESGTIKFEFDQNEISNYTTNVKDNSNKDNNPKIENHDAKNLLNNSTQDKLNVKNKENKELKDNNDYEYDQLSSNFELNEINKIQEQLDNLKSKIINRYKNNDRNQINEMSKEIQNLNDQLIQQKDFIKKQSIEIQDLKNEITRSNKLNDDQLVKLNQLKNILSEK